VQNGNSNVSLFFFEIDEMFTTMTISVNQHVRPLRPSTWRVRSADRQYTLLLYIWLIEARQRFINNALNLTLPKRVRRKLYWRPSNHTLCTWDREKNYETYAHITGAVGKNSGRGKMWTSGKRRCGQLAISHSAVRRI